MVSMENLNDSLIQEVVLFLEVFRVVWMDLGQTSIFRLELRIGGIFLPRNRPTLGPQVQSQSPELLD